MNVTAMIYCLWETEDYKREAEQKGNCTITRKFEVSESCIHYRIAVTDSLFVSKKQNF
jgi:hypothetical protein